MSTHALMTSDATSYRLRALTGADELALQADAPASVSCLLAPLLQDVDVSTLDVTTADRLLAELYTGLYGDRCDCRVRCGACGQAYGFELALSELTARQDADRPACDADGLWRLPDGRRVRAPRVGETGLPMDQLLPRLVVSGEPIDGGLFDFLERAEPVLALDVDAPCPHCGSAQEVRFDLARYLMQRLLGERAFLLREVHLIAARYGWALHDILSLSRDDRRAFAGLIESERAPLARRRLA